MNNKSNYIKILVSLFFSFIIIMIGVGIGSVYVNLNDVLNIILNKTIGFDLPDGISSTSVSIIWKLRFPRALLAFIVGGALSVSGTVMQSVLKNPLASSYTLGVSSGASLGAALIIVTGASLPFFGMFTLPVVGLSCGLLTVYIAVTFAAKLDSNMANNTIILVGMIFSLFINAILTLLIARFNDKIAQIAFWQMGSFALKEWSSVLILFPIVFIGIIILMGYSKELDILTFGEDDAFTMGVDVQKVKWILLGLSSALTGSAVAFVGVIGFIDLIAPHIVRKIFGSNHKIVIPMSFIFGGSFMVICDLIARTIVSPSELPVGAITAIIGSPFFAYLYFSKRKEN